MADNIATDEHSATQTKHGVFVWYELMTSDTKAAEVFYRNVIGWDAQAAPGGMPYTLFTTHQIPVAGMMTLPPEARDQGARPGWIGYINVDDVDASATRVVALGGKILRKPDDIPTVGRFAVAADPQGAVFVLFKPSGEMPRSEPPPPCTPGLVGWHELQASAWEEAFTFYSALFGWTRDRPMDIGAMGIYQLFSYNGGEAIGAMMTKPKEIPLPFWTYYFYVDSVEAAIGRMKENGGTLTHGPHQVPGDQWIALGIDPQGALFALVSPNA